VTPKILTTLTLALAMTLAVRSHVVSDVVPHDDGFITFRYVANLFAGKGLVYNDGERIFGVSSPLYLLWLSLLKLILPFGSLPVLAVRSNAILFLATAGGLYANLIRWTENEVLAALVAAAFCLDPVLLEDSLGGMESFLFAALTLWALFAVSCGRYPTGALLSGLSCLARPEGVLVAATCTAAWLIHSRRSPVRFAVALCFPSLVWLVFALGYFGTVIPESIIAKARPLYPLPRGSGLAQMIQQITEWTFGRQFWKLRTIKPVLAVFLVSVAMGPIVVARLPRRLPAWIIPLLLVLFVGFYSAANAKVLSWYLPVVYSVWILLACAGGQPLVRGFLGRWIPHLAEKHGLELAAGYMVLAFLLACGVGDGVRATLRNGLIVEASPVRLRIEGYARAAFWMNEHFSKNETVAAPEIGALGFYWKGRVLDACGLVSPEALPFLPVPADERDSPLDGPISRELVEALRPEVVVTLNVFAKRSLLASPRFDAEYELVHREPLPHAIWASPDVLIYHRREPALVRGGSGSQGQSHELERDTRRS
jgi:hypothetical protein